MGTDRSTFLATLLTLASALGLACDAESTTPPGSAIVVARLSLASGIDDVHVTVSGSKLPNAISRPLTVAGSQYSAWIDQLPPGGDYTFTAVAMAGSVSPKVLLQGSVSRQQIVGGRTASITIYLNALTDKPSYLGSAPVIDSVAATSLKAAYGETLQFQVTAHDPDPGETALLTFKWAATCGTYRTIVNTPGSDGTGSRSVASYTAPAEGQRCTLSLLVTDPEKHSAATALDIALEVAAGQAAIQIALSGAPVVSLLFAAPGQLPVGGSTVIKAFASDPDGEALDYEWSCSCPGVFDPAGTDTTTFTLAPTSTADSCTFDVVVGDGRDSQGNVKNRIENHLTLAVGTPPLVVSPTFGVTYRSDDTYGDGQSVVLAIEASDPAGGPMTYAWTSSAGPAPVPMAPADLGFDTTVFASAATWTPLPGTAGTSLVIVTVTATSMVSSLSAKYTYVLFPAGSLCGNPTIDCPAGRVCDPQTGGCVTFPL
jgi:hypothetical protein